MQANTAAMKYDPTYNAAKADADFNVAKLPQNVAFFGSANSLTNKGGTLDQLEAQYKNLPNDRKFPLFNKLQDYLSYQSGDPQPWPDLCRPRSRPLMTMRKWLAAGPAPIRRVWSLCKDSPTRRAQNK